MGLAIKWIPEKMILSLTKLPHVCPLGSISNLIGYLRAKSVFQCYG